MFKIPADIRYCKGRGKNVKRRVALATTQVNEKISSVCSQCFVCYTFKLRPPDSTKFCRVKLFCPLVKTIVILYAKSVLYSVTVWIVISIF